MLIQGSILNVLIDKKQMLVGAVSNQLNLWQPYPHTQCQRVEDLVKGKSSVLHLIFMSSETKQSIGSHSDFQMRGTRAEDQHKRKRNIPNWCDEHGSELEALPRMPLLPGESSSWWPASAITRQEENLVTLAVSTPKRVKAKLIKLP